MENDLENNLIEKVDINSENIFKFDYEGQSLKDNNNFKLWKTKMLNIYGNNAILYKCKKDNIYFYVPIKKNKDAILDGTYCQLCKQKVCYFCSENIGASEMYCCIKANIYYLIYREGFNYINQAIDDDGWSTIIKFIFPIFTFFYLIGIISRNLYYLLKRQKGKYKAEEYFRRDCLGWIIAIINGFIAFLLSLIFLLHDMYFKILFLIISIFFKGYPFLIYIGILQEEIRDLNC